MEDENTFNETEIYKAWFARLKDRRAKDRILARIDNAENGNFGDCRPVGEGVSEMRINYGPGYRLYFFKQEGQLYWLLAGGDKDTQSGDIELAKTIKRRIQGGEKC
jgi:putative addiction module killer protein